MQTNKLLINEMHCFGFAFFEKACIIFITALNIAFAWALK